MEDFAATLWLPTTLHPYMSACGIGYISENLFKMVYYLAS